ncbi:putative spermidine/putrescine transport system permease protein [Brevibacterium sandarakinum]|uniref:Spermidine/putrescine transport system permease protein n=1 Tax=Brevibacterium sandarakinum TaxID=629680 RepID=A0A1H1US98_BRESA|nr:ABC transporter permease [Brevibacterium sandarakinum]SDS74986.1 putative spermidine/putrescine transport system permease protein [Brevibacterium sandarakinum]
MKNNRGSIARAGNALRNVLLVLTMFFVTVPMLVVVWTSIQPNTYPKFPPTQFSLKWWNEALTGEWMRPLALSAEIAGIATIISVILGSAAAYALARSNSRARTMLEGFLTSPLLLPEIVISLAVLQFISMFGGSWLGPELLIAAHVTIGIPFVVRTVGVSLVGVDPLWERAAYDLGASRLRTFFTITLPLMKSGIFAGALFAFIMSFNNVELSLFLTSRSATTLPIKILNYMEFEYSPSLAAVAVTGMAGILLIAVIASRFTRMTDFIGGR